MKKVIGFDGWTGGVRHYLRLKASLEARGFDLSLIHLGSWGNDVRHELDMTVEGLRVRDISTYGHLSFREVLQLEKPDAVIFLSLHTFAHRAFNRLARSDGVPTLHLYHGFVCVQAVDQPRSHTVSVLPYARLVLRRLGKMLTRVWPAYVGALLSTRAGRSDWWRFLTDNVRSLVARPSESPATDSTPDFVAVYATPDVQHAQRTHGVDKARVRVVGNPDLEDFGLRAEHFGAAFRRVSRSSVVMYIDTGLIYAGLVYDDHEHFVRHLCETRDRLEQQGLALSVKLHPQHYRTSIPSRLQSAGITIVEREAFVTELIASIAAIVEPSSAAVIPAFLGLPVLLAQYGPLEREQYGKVLSSYPRARYLRNLDEVTDILNEEARTIDQFALCTWITENAGPQPADAMPDRVATLIEEMVSAAVRTV